MIESGRNLLTRHANRMYAFPPPNPPEISAIAFATNVLLLVLALAAALGGFERRNAGWRPILSRWGIATALVITFCGLGLALEECRTYMPLYLGFIWAAVVPVVLASVCKQSQGRGLAIRSVLGWLAVIGVLALLCSPAVSIAKQAGRRVECQNNLRNIGLLFPTEKNASFKYPTVLADGEPPASWRTHVYQMRDCEDRPSPTFDLTRPWNDTVNLAIGRTKFGFVCPANFNALDDAGRY